jgi:hypothetical protein
VRFIGWWIKIQEIKKRLGATETRPREDGVNEVPGIASVEFGILYRFDWTWRLFELFKSGRTLRLSPREKISLRVDSLNDELGIQVIVWTQLGRRMSSLEKVQLTASSSVAASVEALKIAWNAHVNEPRLIISKLSIFDKTTEDTKMLDEEMTSYFQLRECNCRLHHFFRPITLCSTQKDVDAYKM